MGRTRALGVALVACAAAACSGAVTVNARVVTPAAVPLRAFPRIWVAAGVLATDGVLADRLAAHLRVGARSAVKRVSIDRLERPRHAGEIPQATVIVLLESDFDETTRTEWTTRPETVCGPLGCYTTQRPYSYDVPTVVGQLVLTVYDGPSGRVLQRLTVRSRSAGAGYEDLQTRVVENLARRLLQLVDQRARVVEVDLWPVAVARVRAAVAKIAAGQWRQGRLLLERFARTTEMHRLEPEDRARVLYDIAQARRFDESFEQSPVTRLERAERVLRHALELDPEEGRYARALAEIAEQRRDEALLREQRDAAEHNFRLGAPPPPGVPDAPPSYRR